MTTVWADVSTRRSLIAAIKGEEAKWHGSLNWMLVGGLVLCPACSCEITDSEGICRTCGQPLERSCLACTRSVPLQYKFCGHCGSAQLSAIAAARSTRHRSDAIGRREEAERRQLTVLFSDLVGSSGLSEQFDPEDVRDAMRVYYALCADVASRYEGEVAELAGDGVVLYFGHPKAYEDAAERAVSAGLALTLAIGQIQITTPSLKLRVGIATGIMVVGETVEVGVVREREIVGTPVNLAARLQTLAEPNTVVVSELTRTLAGSAFAYRELVQNELKGFSPGLKVFSVLGEATSHDHFDSAFGDALTPMTSRLVEQATLLDRWKRAKDGEGQLCLVSGEPGIGKSRLVYNLRQQISLEEHIFLGFSGSRLHQRTPLYPIAHQLCLATGVNEEDTQGDRRTKLASWLKRMGYMSEDSIPLLLALVESPSELEELRSEQPLTTQKEELLDILIGLVKTLAGQKPVLIVFEDIQWVDTSTRELLERLVASIESLPVLQLVTFRSGVTFRLQPVSNVVNLSLSPLDATSSLNIIEGVLGDHSLPLGAAREIIARTDGVPLFIEELTKAILESYKNGEMSNSSALKEVPGTLHDTLMARLDRHHGARTIAQIGATIGREFPYELLAMIAPMPAIDVNEALSELLQSELVFQQGLPPRARYVFKHALIQEIAYGSQLRRNRRSVHGQIAETLHRHFLDTPPEVLGYHYAQAGAASQAVTEYERAAQVARTRSASADAVAHFERALRLLDSLPLSVDRDRREQNLQIAYGAQLVSVKGNAASEVKQAYNRALDLNKKLGESSQLNRVLRGLQTFYMVRGQLSEARPLGERLIDQAKQESDPNLLLQSHRPHGLCLLYMGDLPGARDHLNYAAAIYDPNKHAQHRFIYGSDPAVLAHCNLAWAEWLLGNASCALHHEELAIEMAKRPEPHPHSRLFALSFSASLYQFRRMPSKALQLAESIIEMAALHQYAYWGPWGKVISGWARSLATKEDSSVGEIHAGVLAYRETGAQLMCPYFLGLQAEALLSTDRIVAGLDIVNEAVQLSETGNIRFYAPELYRIKVQLLRKAGSPVSEQSESLEQAVEEARTQGSRIFELRALKGLYRIRATQDQRGYISDRMRVLLSQVSVSVRDETVDEVNSLIESITVRQ